MNIIFGFYVAKRNYIENAVALIQSIKQQYSIDEVAIKAFSPLGVVNDQLQMEGVESISIEISKAFCRIPFVDKLFAAAKFEALYSDNNALLIWLDVDSYFFKMIPVLPDSPICLNSVDKRNIGIPYTQDLSTLWKWVYKYFDLEMPLKPVHTQITGERLHPYFNVGMVVIKESRGVFEATRKAIVSFLEAPETLSLIMDNDLFAIFMHQAIFTGAVLKLYGLERAPLPKGLNYPWHLSHEDPNPPKKEDLISIRYDFYWDGTVLPI